MEENATLELLRMRLVATVGTKGTIKGYTIAQTIADYKFVILRLV